jgi:uncharacterized membrane protein YeiB
MVKCAAVSSQTKAFWSIFGGFCAGMTYSLAVQGAFDGISLGESLLFVAAYLGVAALINYIVKSLPFTAEE